MPVTIALPEGNLSNDDSNDTPTKSQYLLKNLLDLPGNEFCSCKKVLKPNFFALTITGTVTYPPTPITISGLNSLIIFLHSLNALNKHLTVFIFRNIFLLNPYISIDLKGIPLAGTISFSILLWVPIYKNSLSGSFSLILLIIAKAG